MASITKRGKSWRAQIRTRGISLSESFPTKAQATAWAAKIEADITAQRLGQAPDKTFGDLLSRYRDEVSPKKRSWRFDNITVRRVLEKDKKLADTPLSGLTPSVFADWRDRRLQEVSAGTVLREWNMLSAACTVAMKEWGWLGHNPLRQISKPSAPPSRTRRPVGDEIERILYALGYVDGVTPDTKTARVGVAALFAIETAMRAGEICELTWDNINFDRRVAHLPKTKNGHPRDVPLSKEAIKLLQCLPKDADTAFNVPVASLDVLWRRKGCARAGVEGLHFHDLRREALTRLAKKVDVLTLAKISGHRDLRILSNTYYAPDMADIANQLD